MGLSLFVNTRVNAELQTNKTELSNVSAHGVLSLVNLNNMDPPTNTLMGLKCLIPKARTFSLLMTKKVDPEARGPKKVDSEVEEPQTHSIDDANKSLTSDEGKSILSGHPLLCCFSTISFHVLRFTPSTNF